MDKSAPRRRPLVFRCAVSFVKALLSQWQILGIGIAALLAYLFPNFGRRGGVIESQYDPDKETELIRQIYHFVRSDWDHLLGFGIEYTTTGTPG